MKVGKISLSGEDAVGFVNSLLRPTAEEAAQHNRHLDAVTENVRIRRNKDGFHAEIADLDLSFLHNRKEVTIMTDKELAVEIARDVSRAGGHTYYVGGCVRDALLGVGNKDVDIEVHGITPQTLHRILEQYGHIKAQGASFGVLNIKGYHLDIAQPRKERSNGAGHKDFEVDVDPFIGTKEAAKRRDFTINALMQDVLTDQIVDHYGGMEDLKNGIIRHVDDQTFAEDPLRVLRAAQFAARFHFTLAPETETLCKKMDISGLSRERIAEEMTKALMKSDKPSVFFRVLNETGHLGEWFPEIQALIGVKQNPEYHPEGDVFEHTMNVLDVAAGRKSYIKNESHQKAFMIAALCHDLGKPAATTEIDGKILAIDHHLTGVDPAKTLLKRIYNDNNIRRYVLNMVEKHMEPLVFYNNDASVKKYMRMFDTSVCPDDLIELSFCDNMGKGEHADLEASESKRQYELEMLGIYHQRMSLDHVTGYDMIERGYCPGPQMKDMLDLAHKLQLAGIEKDPAIRQIMGMYKPEPQKKHRKHSRTADDLER